MKISQFPIATVVLVLLQAVSSPAFACAACFGKSDSNLAKGMNVGILALLLVVVSVLGGIACVGLRFAKKSAALEAVAEDFNSEQSQTIEKV